MSCDHSRYASTLAILVAVVLLVALSFFARSASAGKTVVDNEGTQTTAEPDTRAANSPKSEIAGPQATPQPSPGPAPKFRLDPQYKFDFKESPGLKTATFTLPSGARISANFPADLSVGDTFTGTLRTEVSGTDAKLRAINQAELKKCVLQIVGQPTAVTEKTFTRQVPSNVDVNEPFIVLLVDNKQVARATVPIAQNASPTPPNPQLPTCGQMGTTVIVIDNCDGVIAPNDSCAIGGTPLQPLAESPRMRVMQNTSRVAGATQIQYSEQGKETIGRFQNFGVELSAGNLSLRTGQQTTLTVTARGLNGIQQDVNLDIANQSPSIVTLQGGNAQHFDIHPAAVAANGTYEIQRTLIGIQQGAFELTATVTCATSMATPTPSPTPTPTPHGPIPAASPAPSSSPSLCGPVPSSTTYVVKDLKELPTIDGSPVHCMATGVNDAGNVVGACNGKYPGGPVSGSWRAFRSEPGKVIEKKDDLGFPDGAVGGVSFAMAVNGSGNVVGYWADSPTGGTDHKAFWYSGSKMFNLHPPTYPLKVSEAYAMNSLDDVVGTAWSLFSDKYAMIWPHGAHTMINLNDYMDPASKKDWKLIEAYAINDAGEIVGRAKHLEKLHAFLLKGKGAVPIDLGALKDYKDDSSAAYAINACEEVAGYTYTKTDYFHGFVWTEDSGMKDMGTLSDPYIVSYAQAINKKGEVVGTASKGFHNSAMFEGIGFIIGKDGKGAVYSHAFWYGGTELKDLNDLIPSSLGWEINLANSINDKREIAGSGFSKGSPYSKAVLLTLAGVTPTPTPLAKGYIFDNWNTAGVNNKPTKDTTFTIDEAYFITFIADYHWNNGKGAVPGKTGISLKSSTGDVYGPWDVTTTPGQGGAANVNWECHPGITLPPGTYTVVDPDPATWSQNAQSGNSGFTRVVGSVKKG